MVQKRFAYYSNKSAQTHDNPSKQFTPPQPSPASWYYVILRNAQLPSLIPTIHHTFDAHHRRPVAKKGAHCLPPNIHKKTRVPFLFLDVTDRFF